MDRLDNSRVREKLPTLGGRVAALLSTGRGGVRKRRGAAAGVLPPPCPTRERQPRSPSDREKSYTVYKHAIRVPGDLCGRHTHARAFRPGRCGEAGAGGRGFCTPLLSPCSPPRERHSPSHVACAAAQASLGWPLVAPRRSPAAFMRGGSAGRRNRRQSPEARFPRAPSLRRGPSHA